jgi:hypothetical protein
LKIRFEKVWFEEQVKSKNAAMWERKNVRLQRNEIEEKEEETWNSELKVLYSRVAKKRRWTLKGGNW